jgi:hypothetical protein
MRALSQSRSQVGDDRRRGMPVLVRARKLFGGFVNLCKLLAGNSHLRTVQMFSFLGDFGVFTR